MEYTEQEKIIKYIQTGVETDFELALQLLDNIDELPDLVVEEFNKYVFKLSVFEKLPEKYLLYVENIDFKENKLSVLPEKIFSCLNLKKLNIGRNLFETLPDDIGVWHKLENFQCYTNQLKTLPNTIQNWKNLRLLHIADNCMVALPVAIYDCKNIGLLHCYQNYIRYISDDIMLLDKLHNFSAKEYALPTRIQVSQAVYDFLSNVSQTDFFRRGW